MVDQHSAQAHRARIQQAARGLGQGERLWFEVRNAKHTRDGARWKAAVGRPELVGRLFAGASGDGVLFELDYPSQLPAWLDAIAVRPLESVPQDWSKLLFFGCDIELNEPRTSMD